ncbi:hypothetical protein AAE250_16510 [Bacteroides sp. GD17]|jgi:hypothetical protein|uniref:hypothetical protein n=1 Tax=Bacteroides sp. GD17 TaxID=3139826 RepID=UPI0025D8DEAD|nr:hypothetical protein [uncultured Bacteroides sp.]
MDKPFLTYRVGPHIFRIANGSTIDIAETLPALSPFVESMQTNEQPIFELYLEDAHKAMPADNNAADIGFDWEDAHCVIRPLADKAYLVAITPRNAEVPYCMECTDNFHHCTAYLSTGSKATEESAEQRNTKSFILNNFLMMLYAFNAIQHCTLLMHASVVVNKDKGYIFLGKSGTGKSTHTSLWLEHIEGSHLLNDDNPIVHIECLTDKITVYGSPWSGKTPCYRNESAPVGAFVRLEQAPQNEIRLEKTVHAFASLLPSCSYLRQDKEMYAKVVRVVTCIASHARVFHLKCLPDKTAAELAWNAIR